MRLTIVPKEEVAKGLSGLVQLSLGYPLDKREQFSDWEKRPLRTSQVVYAGIKQTFDLELEHKK